MVVETIVAVHSVDLVADPATNRGLAESTAAGDGHESKQLLVAEIARQVGIPADCVPSLDGGLRDRETPVEIREHLEEVGGSRKRSPAASPSCKPSTGWATIPTRPRSSSAK